MPQHQPDQETGSKWPKQEKERERKVPIPAYSISAFLLHTLQPCEWCKHSTEGSRRSVLPLSSRATLCWIEQGGSKSMATGSDFWMQGKQTATSSQKSCKQPLKHITVIKKNCKENALQVGKTKAIMVLSIKLLRKGNSLLWWLWSWLLKLFTEQVDTQLLPKYSRNRAFPLRQNSFAHWGASSYKVRKIEHCIREKYFCLNGKGELAPAQGERKWHLAMRAGEALGCAVPGGITAAQPGMYRPAGNHFKARREWASSKPDTIFSLCLYV